MLLCFLVFFSSAFIYGKLLVRNALTRKPCIASAHQKCTSRLWKHSFLDFARGVYKMTLKENSLMRLSIETYWLCLNMVVNRWIVK